MDAPRSNRAHPEKLFALSLGLLALALLLPTGPVAHALPSPLSAPTAPSPIRSVLGGIAAPAPHAASNWWNITRLSPAVPAGRAISAAAWDPVDGYTVSFGGENLSGGLFGDTWSFSNGTWTQLFPSSSPSPRGFSSMAFDVADGYAVLFGGENTTGTIFGDTWTYVHGQWTNITPLSSPPARLGADMAYDPATSSVIMFGGVNVSGVAVADTWSFSQGAWTELFPSGSPPPNVAGGFAYDAADGYLLLDGGSHNNSNYGEVSTSWRFASDSWTQLTPATHPPATIAPGESYDPLTQSVLLMGGEDTLIGSEPDLWQFHAGSWSEISASTPAGGRSASVVLWQPNAGYLLVFSGLYEATLDVSPVLVPADSWAYAPALNSSPSALPTGVDIGRGVHFTGTITGGVGPYSLSWKFGDGSNSSAPDPTHAFASAGTFTVQLNVTDALGTHVSGTVAVGVHALPTVGIGLSVSANALVTAQNVTFTATGAAGTPPYSFSWKFGDGATAGTNPIVHAYTASGSYTVSVELTDADGSTVNASAPVTVAACTTSCPGAHSSGNSSGSSWGSLLYIVLGIVVVAAVVAAAWGLSRRRRRPPPPSYGAPPAWTPPPTGAAAAPPPPPPPPAGPPPTG